MKNKNNRLHFSRQLLILLVIGSFVLTGTACGFGEVIEVMPNTPATNTTGDVDADLPGEDLSVDDKNNVLEEPRQAIVLLNSEVVILEVYDEPYIADLYMVMSGNTKRLLFTSENEDVFTVNEHGTIFPVAPGTAHLKITAFNQYDEGTVKEMKVIIREPWNPTDPVTKEVVEVTRNKDLARTEIVFYYKQFEMDGPVDIVANRLQLYFSVSNEGENSFDVATGFGKEDYDISFKLFLREKNLEDERTDYKVIHTNLVPFAVHDLGRYDICRCLFYDSGLLDLVQAGKSYETVMVIYKGAEAVAWSHADLEWTETCAQFVEMAEENEEIIK